MILKIYHKKLSTRVASRVTSAQSSFYKLNLDNSRQEIRKIRYYIFEALPNFAVFPYSVPNILGKIVAFNKAAIYW